MGLEVEVRDVGEDEPDDRVAQRAGVERTHEPFTVTAVLDVRQRGGHTRRIGTPRPVDDVLDVRAQCVRTSGGGLNLGSWLAMTRP